MEPSVSTIVLVAKQQEIEELKRLAARAEWVGAIGQLVHALQSERGATSIFLASQGSSFEATRQEKVADSLAAEALARGRFAAQLQGSQAAGGSARLYALMAWALLGLDGLPTLRTQIGERSIEAHEAVERFNSLIAGLLSLVFEVADAAPDPAISRLLVALFNLVQAKEFAGQERAVGGLCFGAGRCEEADQERISYLIDAQERCLQLFVEFADATLLARWNDLQDAPFMAPLERLRRVLCSTRPDKPLDAAQHDRWFEASSARLTGMWELQRTLVAQLQALCAALIAQAESSLQDVEGLLKRLRENPPPTGEHRDDPAPAGQALAQVLREQSDRLAGMQSDLEAARRALGERKLIERAKGVLMERFQITEEAAHIMMRKVSMDQNRRLVDVAEASLSLPAFLASPVSGAAPR